MNHLSASAGAARSIHRNSYGALEVTACLQPDERLAVRSLLERAIEDDLLPEPYPGVEPDDVSALLKYATSVPAHLLDAVATESEGRWHLDTSRTYGDRYYMNHCEHCGAKIGDHYLGEPEEAFFPLNAQQLARISGQPVDGPFLFEDPQLSLSTWTDEWLRPPV